jgi:L-malate glycosyltransferase
MKVLYVNHTGQVSGAERSLLELTAALPPHVTPLVACPPGELARTARSLGLRGERLPRGEPSLRLHPWRTPAGLVGLAGAALAVRRIARREDVDVVHANSARAGLAATVSAPLHGRPVVVHIRDALPDGRVANLTRRVLGRAAAIVANSTYTARAFAADRPGIDIHTLHSPVDCGRFDPTLLTQSEARRRLGLDPDAFVLGVVAQITPWKGQSDAVRALSLLQRRLPSVHLLLVGEAKFGGVGRRYDSQAYAAELRELARALRVTERVTFAGERDDVPEVLRALDILLCPSWEEPFGRSVVEGMAMELPVVATEIGGPAEVIRHGVDGLLLPPRRPELWAEAVERLADPAVREAMGQEGRRRAVGSFGPEAHAAELVELYEEILAREPARARRVAPAPAGPEQG